MISKLLKMQLLEDDDDEFAYLAPSEGDKQKREADGRPVWMRTLANSLANWLKIIPKVRRSTSRFFKSRIQLNPVLELHFIAESCILEYTYLLLRFVSGHSSVT